MNTCFKRIVVLCVITWMCYSALYSQQGDTLYIRRTESGKIAFASFAINVDLPYINLNNLILT